MAAPVTSAQGADLAYYKDVIQYLVAILDKEATIAAESRQLSSGNITKFNTAIDQALDNITDILVAAETTP